MLDSPQDWGGRGARVLDSHPGQDDEMVLQSSKLEHVIGWRTSPHPRPLSQFWERRTHEKSGNQVNTC